MSPITSVIMLQKRGIEGGYGITPAAWELFMKHQRFKSGRTDSKTLAKVLSESPRYMQAINQTIEKLHKAIRSAEDMKTTKMKDIVLIYDAMLELKGMGYFVPHNLFHDLPPEIRNKIYGMVLDEAVEDKKKRRKDGMGNLKPYVYEHKAICPRGMRANGAYGLCLCPNPYNEINGLQSGIEKHKFLPSLAFTCKAISEEVLSYMYHYKELYFPCTCNMLWHMKNNEILRNNVRKIKVLWVGPCAAEAFKELYTLPDLDYLTVIVCSTTTKRGSEREERLRAAFPSTPHDKYYDLKDALGMDELLALRGIEFPGAENVAKWRGSQRKVEEVNQLRKLLEQELRKPHPNFEKDYIARERWEEWKNRNLLVDPENSVLPEGFDCLLDYDLSEN
ncbi:hypothetical protein F5Y04DRAFT_287546 [Hypomontagnella monticulosa]|nr:hypothetical protein F5Y04DRAFT_287546 [Hypomontagnella monticulosa]